MNEIVHILHGQKMEGVKCECFVHALDHIPITNLANIVHEYAAAEPHGDQRMFKFNCIECVYEIKLENNSNELRPLLIITDEYDYDATVKVADGITRIDSSLFPVDGHLEYTYFNMPRLPGNQPIEKTWECFMLFNSRMVECIKMAHRILAAEETGGHLHPDPRII